MNKRENVVGLVAGTAMGMVPLLMETLPPATASLAGQLQGHEPQIKDLLDGMARFAQLPLEGIG